MARTCRSIDRQIADGSQESSGAFHKHSVVKLIWYPRPSVGVPKPTFVRGKEA